MVISFMINDMKTKVLLGIIFLLGAYSAHAEFETWTNAEGKEAELDLISVTEVDGEKQGEFKMRNGKIVTLKISQLDESEGERFEKWLKDNEPEATSVFDAILDRKLIALRDGKVMRYQGKTRPKKYYLFYYTASWCPPCRKFTPKLVDFYHKHAEGEQFEVILISRDRSEEKMESYMIKAEMPWPALKKKEIAELHQEYNYSQRGIPNLVLVDLEGEVVQGSYVDGKYFGPMNVLRELEKLLAQDS